MILGQRTVAICLFITIGFGLIDPSLAGTPPANPDEKVKAVNFSKWNLLNEKQIGLIKTFLTQIVTEDEKIDPSKKFPITLGNNPDWNEIWNSWTGIFDDHAASFLGISRVLQLTYFKSSNGTEFKALDLVKRIKNIKGDRVFVEMDKDLFEDWRTAGGSFRMELANGKFESGKFNFSHGGQVGGSLHKGYDVQGYSSISKVPRLQINFRYSDAEADIDLDGYSPFIGLSLPNPAHLTYKNSDLRFWLDKYSKKFGDPGFTVQKVN